MSKPEGSGKKYFRMLLAAVVFAAAMLIPTFAFPITVSFLGDLEMCRLRSQKEVLVQNRLYIVARNRL